MPETAKPDAVEPSVEETTDVTAPSTVEQEDENQTDSIDFDNMSEEELREFARNEHKAKTDAVAHLREQAKKRRAQIENDDSNSTQDTEEDDTEDEEDRIAQLVEQKVTEKLQSNQSQNYAAGAQDWLLDQAWATPFLPETPGSDELYAKLISETKRLSETTAVNSQEDYQALMKKAAVVVTGRPDALLEVKDTTKGDYQKSMATSPHTSAGTTSTPKISARAAELAKAFGHDPEEMYK